MARNLQLQLLRQNIAKRNKRRRFLTVLLYALWKRRVLFNTCLTTLTILSSTPDRHRSCRRYERNQGWWELVWNSYSDKRFTKTFRISRTTFQFILDHIKHDIQHDVVTETPISPECRLGICLYRLARGDYFYTIAEMVGLGVATVCSIVKEVTEAIIANLWNLSVKQHMPETKEDFERKILDMEELWQFPFCWGAIDGCHIPIKCPSGGLQASKEFHNFKNFYSVVLMAIVDSNYRFVWASCGFPGNSHDSIIFQSTELWSNITEKDAIPNIGQTVDKIIIYPLLLGDSAFPLQTWMMKPYTNAVLTKQQTNFNYRLSRARMVTEGAYGQMKGRWRVLLRKMESEPDQVKTTALACIVLHNICIEKGETLSKKLDPAVDPVTNERRDRDTIRKLLQMRSCEKVKDTAAEAERIRNVLCQTFWQEVENS